MAIYSKFLSLVSGASRTVDLSTNTLSAQGLQINAATGGGAITQLAHASTTSYTISWPAAQAASSGYVLSNDGTGNLSWVSGSAGSVTSVALADGSSTPIYSISGSPVTSSGTLTFSLNNQSANLVFAGPTTGSAAQPSFRSLVSADIPDLSSIYLALAGGTMAGDINMNSHSITSLASPVNPGDAVNKSYVDNFINATSWKTAVLVSSTANINLGSATDPNPVDGVTLSNGDRILLKNQTAPAENGIYVAVTATDPTTWTRSSDMNTWAQVPAAAVFVESGTVGADLGWVCTSQPGGTLGTTAITFVQFSSAGAYSADNVTLQLISGVFSIKNAGVTETQIASSALSSTGALSGGSGTKLSVNVDNSTIDINGSDQLEVKAAGITSTQLASASVTPAKLGSVTDGTTLDQSGAGSTIEIKSGGVGTTQLASAAVTPAKLGSVTDGVTLDQSGAGSTIEIKTAGVGTTQLAAASVTAAKLGSVTDGVTLDQSGAGSTLEIKSAGVSATQLATGAFDQVTITGGAGTPASVANAPVQSTSEVAGQSFAATTLWAVRYALAADSGFVAGRVYKADYDTTSADNFYVIGLAYPGSLVSTAGAITVVESGLINVPSHGFTVGTPVYLSASGAVTGTAPSSSLQAVVKVGIVKDANNIFVQVQTMGIN